MFVANPHSTAGLTPVSLAPVIEDLEDQEQEQEQDLEPEPSKPAGIKPI